MDIIGKTTGGYIVAASADEIARVAGHPYSTQHREVTKRDLEIGNQVIVSDLYDRLTGIRACEARLIAAQSTLRAVAEMIGPVADCISYAVSLGAKEST